MKVMTNLVSRGRSQKLFTKEEAENYSLEKRRLKNMHITFQTSGRGLWKRNWVFCYKKKNKLLWGNTFHSAIQLMERLCHSVVNSSSLEIFKKYLSGHL